VIITTTIDERKWLNFDEIRIGSIWMAADGGGYGHYVVGKHENGRDILVNAFTVRGWENEDFQRGINWWKLQYRYYPVA
jgi:hypothetical protein